ncbi:MAG: TonB-dependent receptor, partial [Flavobacteriales bacterium]|nr:TonB-dependent receptor [Flavobacteriales bacterium]
NSSIKLAAGMGSRTPNAVMENVGLLASSREWIIRGNANDPNFGLPMERAANYGVNYLQKFRAFYRDASFSVDFYRTEFTDQLVVDMDASAREVNIYALDGKSYSNSAQVEMQVSPARRFDVRLAYRFLDVKTDYDQGLLAKPLVANHRGFTNLAYETKASDEGSQWRFDATLQWIGSSRIPDTSANPEEFQVSTSSDDYLMLGAQVTKAWSADFEIYLGGENLTNFRQPNPIIDAQNPFGENFDASLIWAPIFGRMAYVGLRWKIR